MPKKKERKNQTILTRLKICYTALTSPPVFEIKELKNCKSGNTQIIVNHILTHCVKYRRVKKPLNISTSKKY